MNKNVLTKSLTLTTALIFLIVTNTQVVPHKGSLGYLRVPASVKTPSLSVELSRSLAQDSAPAKQMPKALQYGLLIPPLLAETLKLAGQQQTTIRCDVGAVVSFLRGLYRKRYDRLLPGSEIKGSICRIGKDRYLLLLRDVYIESIRRQQDEAASLKKIDWDNIVILNDSVTVPYIDKSGAIQIDSDKIILDPDIPDEEVVREVLYSDYIQNREEYERTKLPGIVKKVLLIQPGFPWQENEPTRFPTGLLSVASSLRKDFPELAVSIVDMPAEQLDIEALLQKIRQDRPQVIGISEVSVFYPIGKEIARRVKREFPDILLVAGGVHPSALPQNTLKHTNFDVAVVGEGEKSFSQVIGAFGKGKTFDGIGNIVYKQNGRIITNPPDLNRGFNLKDIPAAVASLDLLGIDHYDKIIEGGITYPIMSTRGCPYKCAFCGGHAVFPKIRFREPESVVDEIEYTYRRYGIKFFHFLDDTFTVKREHARRIAELIIERGLPIKWMAMTRADAIVSKIHTDGNYDEEKAFLSLLKNSGCVGFAIGVESGDPKMLKLIDKKTDLDVLGKATELVKQAGIHVKYFLMVGLPGQDNASVQKSIDVIKQNKPDSINVTIVKPLPGSELFALWLAMKREEQQSGDPHYVILQETAIELWEDLKKNPLKAHQLVEQIDNIKDIEKYWNELMFEEEPGLKGTFSKEKLGPLFETDKMSFDEVLRMRQELFNAHRQVVKEARRIPVFRRPFSSEKKQAVLQNVSALIDSEQFEMGEYTRRLEDDFAQMVGAKFAVGVSNGTLGLELVLRAKFGSLRGKTIIVPANTNIADVTAVIHAGGNVAFVDVSKETLSIDPEKLRKLLKEKKEQLNIVGMIVVHMGGFISDDIEQLQEIAKTNDLFLLEDASHAHGSTYKGIPAGRFGDAAVFSLFSTKVLTSFNGGIIVTDDAQLYSRLHSYRSLGRIATRRDEVYDVFGGNYRMDELQAIVGLSDLQDLSGRLRRRRKIAEVYDDSFKEMPGLRILKIPDCEPSFYKYILLIDPKVYPSFDYNKLKVDCAREGVDLPGKIYGYTLDKQVQPEERIYVPADGLSVTRKLSNYHIALPMYETLTKEQARYVVEVTKGSFKQFQLSDTAEDISAIGRILANKQKETSYAAKRQAEEKVYSILRRFCKRERSIDTGQNNRVLFEKLSKILSQDEGITTELRQWDGFVRILPEVDALRYLHQPDGTTLLEHTFMLLEIFERIWRLDKEDIEWLQRVKHGSVIAQEQRLEEGLPPEDMVSEENLIALHDLFHATLDKEEARLSFILSLLFHDVGKLSNAVLHEQEGRRYFRDFCNDYGYMYKDIQIFEALISLHTQLSGMVVSQEISPAALAEDLRGETKVGRKVSHDRLGLLVKLLTMLTVCDEATIVGFVNNKKYKQYLDFSKISSLSRLGSFVREKKKRHWQDILMVFGGMHMWPEVNRAYQDIIAEKPNEDTVFKQHLNETIDVFDQATGFFRVIRKDSPDNVVKMLGLVTCITEILKRRGINIRKVVFNSPESYADILSGLNAGVFTINGIEENLIRKESGYFIYGMALSVDNDTLIFEEPISKQIERFNNSLRDINIGEIASYQQNYYQQRVSEIFERLLDNKINMKEKPVRFTKGEGTLVEVEAPARIELLSAFSSDLPSISLAEGGCVLNIAADIDGEKPIKVIVRVIKEPVIRFKRGEKEHTVSSKKELLEDTGPNDPFRLMKTALKVAGIVTPADDRALSEVLITAGGGLEIETRATTAAGAGTSSILGLALLEGLYSLMGCKKTEQQMNEDALLLEHVLQSEGGWNDPLGALYPGIKELVASQGSINPTVHFLELAPAVERELQQRLILWDSGISRDNTQEQSLFKVQASQFGISELLRRRGKDMHDEMKEALMNGDFISVGALLNEGWRLWKMINPVAFSGRIDEVITEASEFTQGVINLGSGGGGYVIFLAKEGERDELISLLNQHGKVCNWTIDREGIELSVTTVDATGNAHKQTFTIAEQFSTSAMKFNRIHSAISSEA